MNGVTRSITKKYDWAKRLQVPLGSCAEMTNRRAIAGSESFVGRSPQMEVAWVATAALGHLDECSYGADAHRREAVGCVMASSATIYQMTHLMSCLLHNYY